MTEIRHLYKKKKYNAPCHLHSCSIAVQCDFIGAQKIKIQENKGKHFEYTIELLQEQNPLMKPLIADLKRIHRYYECTINCTPMTVSQEMCLLARKVLTVLDQITAKLPLKLP